MTGQGGTVGEKVQIQVTLKNNSDKPVVVPSVRAALEEQLPIDLEVRGGAKSDEITLAAGQSTVLSYELVPFDGGEIAVSGITLYIPLEKDGQPVEAELVLPDFSVSVKSRPHPRLEREGLQGHPGSHGQGLPQRRRHRGRPCWRRPFLAGALRLRRKGEKAPAKNLEPLLDSTRKRIEALEKNGGDLKPAAFYDEVYSILAGFSVDFFGLPIRERSAGELTRDLKASGKFSSGQLSVIKKLATDAEAYRFGGRTPDAEARRRDLIALRELVKSVSSTPPLREGARPLRDHDHASGGGHPPARQSLGPAPLRAFGGLHDLEAHAPDPGRQPRPWPRPRRFPAVNPSVSA